jgi:hypothetical protein
MITQQLVKSIANSPVELTVQQLLFTEVQVSPQLHALADMHRSTLLAPYIRLCECLNSHAPHIDADIMLTVFTQLEYRYVAMANKELVLENINATVSRIIGNIMNLKG